MSVSTNTEEIKLSFSEEEIICPFCSSLSTKRIPRGVLIRNVLFWTNLKRYICHRCLKKFYKRNSLKISVKQKRIKLIVSLSGQHILVKGNPMEISKAINNLLSNIIKFTAEHGTIEINYKESNDHYIMNISDNSIEISDAFKQKNLTNLLMLEESEL